MKNELGIEVCCENCYRWESCNFICKGKPCVVFLPSIEALYNRIKELKEQAFTKAEACTVLFYMKQANLIIKNENEHIPNIESIFSKLKKMKGE